MAPDPHDLDLCLESLDTVHNHAVVSRLLRRLHHTDSACFFSGLQTSWRRLLVQMTLDHPNRAHAMASIWLTGDDIKFRDRGNPAARDTVHFC